MPEIEIYREALRRWGPEAQMLMAFEEMSELQKELCKAARGKQNKAEIAEEIADVQIMLGGNRMNEEKECCGTCKWHQHENITDGWVCVNGDSEYCTDFTDYEHSCPDWEGRK